MFTVYGVYVSITFRRISHCPPGRTRQNMDKTRQTLSRVRVSLAFGKASGDRQELRLPYNDTRSLEDRFK
jgi:hypothetical protein